MDETSNRPGPNPFAPGKHLRPNQCQAHMLLYGGQKPCTRSRASGLKVCEGHAVEMAKSIGWMSPSEIDRTVRARGASDAYELGQLRRRVDDLIVENADLRREVTDLVALPAKERRAKRKAAAEGHIYFLLSDNAVKIGWTSDLEQRMKSYSPGTKILAVMPGARKDETRLHRKFSHLRTNRREWFAYSPQVMEEVERVVREHGEPPRELNEPVTTKRIVGPRLNGPMRVKDYRG